MKKIVSIIHVVLVLCLLAFSAMAAQDSINDNSPRDEGSRLLFHSLADTAQERCYAWANATNSTADVTWSSNLTYSIDGIMYYKAAGTGDISAMRTWTAQANGTTAYYTFYVDASGTVNGTRGNESKTGTAWWPTIPDDAAPIFGMKVVVASTAQFTPGTTLFGVGNTTTFYNLASDPAKILAE